MAKEPAEKKTPGEMTPLGADKPIRGKQPQDHLPPKNERVAKFEFGGEMYTAPADYFADFETLEALEDGRIVTVVRGLLGEDQLARVKDHIRAENGGKLPLTAFEPLISAAAEATPFDQR